MDMCKCGHSIEEHTELGCIHHREENTGDYYEGDYYEVGEVHPYYCECGIDRVTLEELFTLRKKVKEAG